MLIPDIAVLLLDHVVSSYEDKEWILDELAQEFFILQTSKVRKLTLERNKAYYQNHVFPCFGSHLIDTIKPIELERWQNDLLQKYKPSTVQKFCSILYSIFDKAVDNDIIDKKPLERVLASKVMPNLQNLEENADPFSEEELKTIIENANGYMKNFILFMYSCWMCPGEIVVFQWSDIDFECKTINVTKTRIQNEDGRTKLKYQPAILTCCQ